MIQIIYTYIIAYVTIILYSCDLCFIMIYHIYHLVGNESRDYLTFFADFGMFWVL